MLVQRQGFEAGGGSGIVASRRYPGVLWAIRDRDRGAAVTLGKVGVLAGQVSNLSGADLSSDRARLNLLAENRDVFYVPTSAYEG